jgi:hypothetical protein
MSTMSTIYHIDRLVQLKYYKQSAASRLLYVADMAKCSNRLCRQYGLGIKMCGYGQTPLFEQVGQQVRLWCTRHELGVKLVG